MYASTLHTEGFFVPVSPKGEAEAEIMAYLESEQHSILVNGGHLDSDAVEAIQDDWTEHGNRSLKQRQVEIPEEIFHAAVVIGLIFEDPHRFTNQGTVFFNDGTISYLQNLGLPVRILPDQEAAEYQESPIEEIAL